ncbi:hypothetical protein PVAND_007665 [Polypedilum vanderplanki]|uniref:Large ribosomal subunit protein mL52 n=1 Tax=Polypedilum vanderplanki TaxID=319348 RepID=A0A9J6C7W2_POLVA|nr:hypothetical protein PVAND_007665 [Polypedilum vanderplanki]
MLQTINKYLVKSSTSFRKFHWTANLKIDQKWRREMRLPTNPNKESPLTCLADFTYMDGRQTPLGKNQKRRLMQQRKFTQYIVKGISEIDFAVERFERLQTEAKQKRAEISDSKLKMKGFKLLQKQKVEDSDNIKE